MTAEDHIKVYHDVLKREAELAGGGLKIAAFNIRIFGVKKFSKEEVVEILVRVSGLLQFGYFDNSGLIKGTHTASL